MSMIQKLLVAVLPAKWAQNMEAESRAWVATCPTCASERSIWELGGVRWGAGGNPKRLLPCPKCAQNTWHVIAHRAPQQ